MSPNVTSISLLAPAKLNLTLEVLRRREDGYHDVASLMQTIDVADRLRLSVAEHLELRVSGEYASDAPAEPQDNLAYRAAAALAATSGRSDLGARIELEKRVPAGMGLGGGSSDAAAVLRGLNRLWRLGLEDEALVAIAAGLGSDVAFFLTAGTALATGRGEAIEALPDAAPLELTLLLPDTRFEEKTRRMYGLLQPSDYGDGSATERAVSQIRRGDALAPDGLVNCFERPARAMLPSLVGAMDACRAAGLTVTLCGSGPALFSPLPLAAFQPSLLAALSIRYGVRAVAARTLARAQALAVEG